MYAHGRRRRGGRRGIRASGARRRRRRRRREAFRRQARRHRRPRRWRRWRRFLGCLLRERHRSDDGRFRLFFRKTLFRRQTLAPKHARRRGRARLEQTSRGLVRVVERYRLFFGARVLDGRRDARPARRMRRRTRRRRAERPVHRRRRTLRRLRQRPGRLVELVLFGVGVLLGRVVSRRRRLLDLLEVDVYGKRLGKRARAARAVKLPPRRARRSRLDEPGVERERRERTRLVRDPVPGPVVQRHDHVVADDHAAGVAFGGSVFSDAAQKQLDRPRVEAALEPPRRRPVGAEAHRHQLTAAVRERVRPEPVFLFCLFAAAVFGRRGVRRRQRERERHATQTRRDVPSRTREPPTRKKRRVAFAARRSESLHRRNQPLRVPSLRGGGQRASASVVGGGEPSRFRRRRQVREPAADGIERSRGAVVGAVAPRSRVYPSRRWRAHRVERIRGELVLAGVAQVARREEPEQRGGARPVAASRVQAHDARVVLLQPLAHRRAQGQDCVHRRDLGGPRPLPLALERAHARVAAEQVRREGRRRGCSRRRRRRRDDHEKHRIRRRRVMRLVQHLARLAETSFVPGVIEPGRRVRRGIARRVFVLERQHVLVQGRRLREVRLAASRVCFFQKKTRVGVAARAAAERGVRGREERLERLEPRREVRIGRRLRCAEVRQQRDAERAERRRQRGGGSRADADAVVLVVAHKSSFWSVVSLGRRFGVGRCRVGLEEHPPACAGRNAAARGRGRRPRVVRLVVVRAVGRGTGAGRAALHGAHRDGFATAEKAETARPAPRGRPGSADWSPTVVSARVAFDSAPRARTDARGPGTGPRSDGVARDAVWRSSRCYESPADMARVLFSKLCMNCITALRASRPPPADGRTRCPRRRASP